VAPLRCRSRASVELAYSLTSAFSPPTPKEAGISPPRKALNLTGIKTRRWPSVKSDERTQKHDPSHVVSAIARSRNEARNWKDQLAKVRELFNLCCPTNRLLHGTSNHVHVTTCCQYSDGETRTRSRRESHRGGGYGAQGTRCSRGSRKAISQHACQGEFLKFVEIKKIGNEINAVTFWFAVR